MTGVGAGASRSADPRCCASSRSRSGAPGPGQARIRQTAVGLNFIDVYFRTGLYPAPSLPFTPGLEGAGVVEAIGEGVSEVAVGAAGRLCRAADRRLCRGAADARPTGWSRLPDGISDEQAAAMMLKGMTAQYLLRRTFRVAARARPSCSTPRPAASG